MKSFLNTISLFILSLCLSFSTRTAAQTPINNQIETIFKDFVSTDKPGVSVSVVKDGKVIYEKGFGIANLEYNVPITEHTVFHAASLAKQFTAFSILLLEKEGKLSLDDDVRKYIPEVPDFGEIITLRHLATHTSGLKDQWRLLELAGWRLDDVITKTQILKLIEKQKGLNFKPGEATNYSNTGFTLLAEVVARVSGQTFAEFTEKHIFKPLGMLNSQFYDDHEKIVQNRAHSYVVKDGIIKKKTLSFANVGATSLLTTAADLAKWAQNFQNPIVGDSALIERLNTGITLNNGKETGYALGQFVGTYQGIKFIVHSASDAGFRGYFGRNEQHNVAVAVLANSSTIEPINYVFEVLNIFLKEHYETNESSEKKSNFEPDPATFVTLSRKQLQKFTGDFWEPIEGYRREIRVEKDTLVYNRPGGNKTKLVPVGQTEFKMLDDPENVSVIFNTTPEGNRRMQVIINDNKPLDFFGFSEVDLQEFTGTFYSEELDVSYTLTIKNNNIVVEHLRREDVELSPINNMRFKSKNRNFANVIFKRSNNNKVTGFYASSEGAKNLWFEKKDGQF